MNKDKVRELHRYDSRARAQLSEFPAQLVADEFGSFAVPEYLRTPYIFYEKCVRDLIGPHHQVLELGAGSGLHTWALVQTGAVVTATDISLNALKLLEQRMLNASGGLVTTQVADMECLPFDASSFDVIVSAGSLSYGDPHLVDTEIRRVLRPGGMIICIDSLNHNPVYRVNRWVHYLRGNRSKSTLMRMPDMARISALSAGFSKVTVRYFGALSFAMPMFARLFGKDVAQVASDRFDQFIGVERLAFKFVLVAQERS
jgi:ubiquinone/menaquinone biosynthesis C-methylase UbiE